MNPFIVTPPTGYPVSLAEAKEQLQIETGDYDARIAGLVAAATELAETYTGRVFMQRSLRAFLNWWPRTARGMVSKSIELYPAPLLSFTTLTTYDDQDNPTVFDPSQYYVDTVSTIGKIVLRRGDVWTLPYRTANAIQLDWVAGYGPNPGQTPEMIRLAIKILIGALNEQRGDDAFNPQAFDFPPAVKILLQPFVVWPPA